MQITNKELPSQTFKRNEKTAIESFRKRISRKFDLTI